MQCLSNLLLNTDSYKASHWLQYPPGTDATFFYVESRGGLYDRTLFYGLQSILKEYVARPITDANVAEARELFAAHGEPFNEAGWRSSSIGMAGTCRSASAPYLKAQSFQRTTPW